MKEYTSFETAHVTPDYPYGYTLRCERREWIETAKKGAKKGQQRFVTCTKNPKTNRWNKPKGSTYSLFAVMKQDPETGHIGWAEVSEYSSTEYAEKFLSKYRENMEPHRVELLEILIAQKKAIDHAFKTGQIKWTINGVVQN